MNIDDIIENARLKGRVIALEAEVERLKAENAWIKGEEYVHTELGSLVSRRLLEHWIEKAKDLEKTKNEFREIGLSIDEENERLKAEVEVQNQRIDRRDEDVGRLYCENSRLKAEVERLRSSSFVTAVPSEEYEKLKAENSALKAEVKRLRKAGDELRDSLPYIVDERLDDKTMRKIMKRWNAAKEGKQS